MPPRHTPSEIPPDQSDRPIDEGVLLGYLMLSDPHPDAIAAVQPHLFRNLGHRLTLATIIDIRKAGANPCPMAVCAALERSGDLETAGGRGYLCQLTDGVPQGPKGWPLLRSYLESVIEAATKHKLRLLAHDLAAATNNGHEPQDIAELAQGIISASQGSGPQQMPWIDLAATPEPGKWLVRSIIPEQGRLLLVAPSGVGKSWILEDLALSVAIGTPWLGQEEYSIQGNQGPVLIVDEESAASRIRYRLSRLAAGRGLELADLKESIYVSCLAGVNVGDTKTWNLLLAEVKRLKPSLVILDAAIRIIAGNENESQYVGPFWAAIGALQVEGPAVAIAHHTGWLEKERPRGSTDWQGGADCVLTLSKTDEPDKQKLTWSKMKDPPDYRDPEPIYIERSGHQQVTLAYAGLASDDKALGIELDSSILQEIINSGGYVERPSLLARFNTHAPVTIDRAVKRLKATNRLKADRKGYSIV